MKNKFFILDGSSLLYRAFYAIPLLESASGEYTNAIYGFSNMLVKLISQWKPDLLVIAFDKGKKTFRNEMFPAYKGTRKPTPPELLAQIPILHEMAEAWGIPLVELAGFEADDIIGTLSNRAVKQGYEAYVVTGDRDALQLVKPDLKVLFTKKGISELTIYDEAAFESEYGLVPEQLIDMKGLMGDTSDNIPGVPGVGPKTAIKLLSAYGSVEEVLLHIEELSGNKLKENIRNNQQQAILSKQLATIKTDVPVDFDEDSFVFKKQGESLIRFYTRYNIRSMVKAVQPFLGENEEVSYEEKVLPECHILDNAEKAQDMLQKAQKEGTVYIAVEFEGKAPQLAPVCAGIRIGQNLYYVETGNCNVPDADGMESLFAEDTCDSNVWSFVQQVLADFSITKCIHGLKRLYHGGLQVSGKLIDLELVGYLLNPVTSKYDVPELVRAYDGEWTPPGKEANNQHIVSWQAFVMGEITKNMMKLLDEKELNRLYWEMELPLVKVLADMEKAGVFVNRSKLQEQAVQVGGHIAQLETQIYELAGQSFNINSPKQLGEILFEKLGLPVIKKTKTGYSTNAEVLEQLQEEHSIIQKILDYRMWTKLKSTYLDGIGSLISKDSQRVHTSFNQTVTATGRLSSSDPNLQNIPVRTEAGKQIRMLFEPGDGYDYLLSADYSQIELRVLAAMSGDESFIKAFNNNEDIHARTAAEVFGVPIEEVTPVQRRNAKAVNFGIVYGISDFGLSQDLKISRKEAAGYIESYFEKCKGVKAFIDQVVEEAHTNGYVITQYGRRRDLPAINGSNYMQRMLAERMAMNTPIQGTAADIIKLAMIRAYNALQESGLKSRILLQVHDELVLEVVESELENVKAILKEAMENVVKLPVPLIIDINIGRNWAEAK